MNITYLILLHNNPQQAYQLIERLCTPDIDFFIHVDLKAQEDFSHLSVLPNVNFSSQRFSIEWGGISMVEALSFCCKEALHVCKGEMICFLSGNDYPVKSNVYIRSFLMQHNTVNFVAASSIPSSECSWLEHGKRRITCYALRLKVKSIATIEPRCFNLSNMKQLLKVLRDRPRIF